MVTATCICLVYMDFRPFIDQPLEYSVNSAPRGQVILLNLSTRQDISFLLFWQLIVHTQ